ncbi:TetR/AcrR family transcriptional regulator [Streptomyces sp. VRA16 Mangrove soil]|uniref:TetR/AcrR family transcriptional regulator n=1 Tax=Streptomyces sp. VRA16 Mangrove soil TaxID=2817434 RepID=UPI001A9F2817|nr:TetR/AcrR family transcriptional regulator [Streptomyces sp. VRA16 Mangrove soil]MBO1337929.1 TetR/AcrR family transcriptional regulator [Streptomyces sp. VRA16 Mangrove soil]
MRADARRNRERLLAAADTVFTTRGTSVSTEEVAKEAGVGVGTLFRHFPTKEALLEAVFQARMDAAADRMERLAEEADAGAAFREMFLVNVAESHQKNAYIEALAAAGIGIDETAAGTVRTRLRATLDVLLRRAQDAGTVRTDVTAQDVIALMVGAARATEHSGGAAELILDGLSPR